MSDDDSNDSGSKPPKIGGKISKGTVLHFPANTGEVTRRRLLLRSAGFPPIPIEGKAPKINGWQNMGEASERMIAGWEGQYPRQLSTGILSATVPGFDIDIMGEAGAQAAEEFVLNWFKDRGKILIRVGQPPKRLIPFRTVNGFRKKNIQFTSHIIVDGKPKYDQLEFLGQGQQFVAFGRHPDTGGDYVWHGGSPGEVGLKDLPLIEEAEAEKLIEALCSFLEEHHHFQRKPGGGRTASRPDNPFSRPPAEFDRVKAALEKVSSDDRNLWFPFCVALERESRDGDGPEWFELFVEWSAKSAKFLEPDKSCGGKFGREALQMKWEDVASKDYNWSAASIFWAANMVDPSWSYRFDFPDRIPPTPPVGPDGAPVDDPGPIREERFTDLGNAIRLVRLHGVDLRRVHAWKNWLIWDQDHWVLDDSKNIEWLAKDSCESMFPEAMKIKDEDRRKAFRSHAMKSQAAARINAAITLAESEPGMSLYPRQIDADPLILGVQNGLIDLRSGEFRPPKREDYVLKRAAVAYDPKATCPRWLEFLRRILPEDMQGYVQRVMGYTLTGQTGEEKIFVWWGDGANGKSTFRETMFSLMGDYAMGSDASLMVTNKQPGGATPEIVRLHGMRMVTINETQQGDVLNEARVKFITTPDILTGRNLYEQSFDFRPTHKGFITTQHKPIIKGTDEGMWRRIHLWPFTVVIPKPERNPNYRQEVLEPELQGILNWALVGLKDYQTNGLGEPPTVVAATEEYRGDMDLVARWIDEQCLLGEAFVTRGSELHNDYAHWSESEVGFAKTPIAFGRDLAKRFTPVKIDGGRGGRGFKGLKLKVDTSHFRS